MTPEGIVVAAVEEYFSQSQFQKFSIEKEYIVQMGRDKRRADVVLVDRKGHLAAIAECKQEGVNGNGIDQLKSYLSATATTWGMFANSEDDNQWKFYQNLGKNEFKEITRSEFERRVVKNGTNLLTRVSDFFSRFFQPGPSEPEPEDSSNGETPNIDFREESLPDINPDTDNVTIKPSIGGRIFVNTDHQNQVNSTLENEVDPTPNETLYYSADDGFASAAKARGVTKALREHIDIIVRSRDLEITPSPEQFQTKIDQLIEKRDDLENDKQDQEREITEMKEELAKKEVHLAGLKVEQEISAGDQGSVLSEDPSSDSKVSQGIQKEMNDLKKKKKKLEKKIESNSRALETKEVERTGLQVELEAPTQIELNAPAVENGSQILSQQGFSFHQWMLAGFATLALLGLLVYLFIFYASAGDKAFTAGSGTVQQSLNEIVNPFAFLQAFKKGQTNWFILTFPFIFIVLALVTHLCWEHKERWLLLSVLSVTFTLDFIIAIKISQNVYEAKKARGLLIADEAGNLTEWSLWNLDVFAVLFLGFAISLLLGFGLYWVLRVWNSKAPKKVEVEQSEQLEKKIKAEKNQFLVQLANLNAQIQNLEGRRKSLNEQRDDCQNSLKELLYEQEDLEIPYPIEVEIARSKTEMEILQVKINQGNVQINRIQEKIDDYQAKINDLAKAQREKVKKISEMEAQVKVFVTGWSRYVTHKTTELTDEISMQLEEIRAVTDETLKTYTTS